ncbi:MAG: hypothetical protein HYT89_02035 [Candidatus Omnitrophica bacterium]|nr:hypothetical protein [Candidatus Omnitrophota bacterium]
MSCLAFFPWLEVKSRIQFGDLALTPFERNKSPFGAGSPDQSTCDGVLEPYHDGKHPVQKATLLEHGGVFFGDVSQEAAGEYFVFRDIVACSSLGKREFFGFGFPYWNSGHFEMVIQNFVDPHGSIAVTSRRRDGKTTHHMTREDYFFRRPFQVSANVGIDFDRNLVTALLAAKDKSPVWHEYYDAISNFNQANTDSDQRTEAEEAVMLIGAFQRLLRCTASGEDDLTARLTKVLNPFIHLEIENCEKIQNFTHYKVKASTVTEAWISDFFKLRGENAHGKRLPRGPLVWASMEHLLLASFLFPHLLKLQLQEDGYYKLTDDDEADLMAFEPLLAAKCLEKTADGKGWIWSEVFRKVRSDYLLKKCMEPILAEFFKQKLDGPDVVAENPKPEPTKGAD